MCTGIFSRAQTSQTGSSSGSSSFSRVPSVFFAVRPKFFKSSPRPFAPAFTSSSICFAVRAPNPGPIGSRKLIVVNATMRSGYGLCLMTSSICVRRSPDAPDTFTINCRFWPSIALTTAA